jgi:hypothetical protein
MDDVTRTELLDHEVGAYGFNQDTRDAFERELGDGLALAGDAGEVEGGADQQDGDGDGEDEDEGEGEGADGDESEGEDEDGDESEDEDEERRAEREARAAALLAEEGTEDNAGADDEVDRTGASGGATSADAGPTGLEAEGDHAGSDDDGDNDSQEPLENLRESNRAQLAFRDRAVAPASVQARKQKKGGAEVDAPAAHLHRGHIDPNAVRQRVAAQINRSGKKGASKAKRNRNKDTSKIDRRAATKMTADW